jgi:hypothetical protein
MSSLSEHASLLVIVSCIGVSFWQSPTEGYVLHCVQDKGQDTQGITIWSGLIVRPLFKESGVIHYALKTHLSHYT